MVSAAAWAWAWAGGLITRAGPIKPGPEPDPARSVRAALARGNYPWYDPKTDAVRPVWPPREWNFDWLDRWSKRLPSWRLPWGMGRLDVGELIMIGLALLALTILIVVLVELWRRHRPPAHALDSRRAGRAGIGARVEGLPEGLRPETADPWAEALGHRARGNYARAIVCLFAHQLLTLDRLRLLRLAPGRTGRQLVRAIADRQLRGYVEPTLRLFETVYYGHQAPTAEAFEAVWAQAEDFERRIAAEPVP